MRERSEAELGVYGIGMKLSALSQAHEVTVVSKKDGSISVRRISPIILKKTILINYYIIQQIQRHTKNHMICFMNNWSTMILLEDTSSKWELMNKGPIQSLQNEIGKIKIHLGLTYHRIIRDNPDKSLKLNGRRSLLKTLSCLGR